MSHFEIIERVQNTLHERKHANPETSYASSLYAKGTEAICAKIMEEANEVVQAAREDNCSHLPHEICDLWFHTMVLMSHFDIDIAAITSEFARREGVSGIDEKKARNK